MKLEHAKKKLLSDFRDKLANVDLMRIVNMPESVDEAARVETFLEYTRANRKSNVETG